jgi:hypothetical protein
MVFPFAEADFYVQNAAYLDSERVSGYLERKVMGDLTLEDDPEDLINLLMPVDTELTSRITNTLDLAEIPRSSAVYGGTEDIATLIGTPAIDEEQITAYRLANKSIYPLKAGMNPEYRSKMDMAAIRGITNRRNQARVETIIANAAGAAATAPNTPGSFTIGDIYDMEATIQVSDSATAGREGEGGRLTHLLFHPTDWARLRKDPQTSDLARIEALRYAPGVGELNKFRDYPYKVLVTNYATPETVIGWDYDRYMLEVVSVQLREWPFDGKLSGNSTDEGTLFLGMVGFGLKVHGVHYATIMDITP